MLSQFRHVNQHQSLLDPWYMEFSSCLNHGPNKTAKGSKIILLSNWGEAKDNPGTARDTRDSQGPCRERARIDRDRAGIARDRAGIARDS